MYKVLIPQDVAESGKKYLRDQGYEVVIGTGWDIDTLKREIADADALLFRTAKYPAEVLEAAKKLKIASRFGVGYDNIDIEKAAELGIWVAIAQGANAMSVAEHTIALLLACSFNIVKSQDEIKKGNWEIRNQLPGIEMNGKTIGILGVGTIGKLVAEKARYGLGMKVIGYDVASGTLGYNCPEYIEMKDSMEDVLKESDVVSVHTPLDKNTRGLIGEKELSMMKRTAILINCARGGIIDESALEKALKEKQIYAAALDVFTSEPVDLDNGLLKLDNFLASPHNAALTKEANVAVSLAAAKAIDAVLKGGRPAYPVNEPIFKSN